MIAPNPNLLCEQTKLYYYDFLCDESCGLIPESITDHIEQCQHCHEQINRLQVVLAQSDEIEPEQIQAGPAITVMLKLHFACIGKPVTCKTVRPFLPGLLDLALEIRIPTPITAHLDNCRQCAEDLETIRRLNLNRKQLRGLSQLFADEISQESAQCSEIGEIITSAAAMDFSDITAEALKHLCKCPVCRDSLYQERQKMCESLQEHALTSELSCESISATDIFDYIVPYGLDPADDQYAKFRESLTSHMRCCRICLAEMQELHRTIYDIAERAESEVVTIYHIDESAKAQALSDSDDLYAGFPVRVEIAGREDRVGVKQPGTIVDFSARLKQKVSALNVKPLLKTGVAAAAVIFVGLALLLYTPTAKAVTIEQIYKAIEKIKNVYIASFAPDGREPIQKLWVSNTLRIQQIKTKKESVLLDLANKVRRVKYLGTGVVETAPLSAETITETEKMMVGFFGLVPFSDLSVIPKDAEWNSVADNSLEATGDIEIYDLTWADETYDGSIVFKKWRVFVNPKTNLPQKTEYYRKSTTDNEYTLRSMKIIEYLSDGEMEAVFKEASF